VTLDDLERQNRGFYGFFWRFWAATQVWGATKHRTGLTDRTGV